MTEERRWMMAFAIGWAVCMIVGGMALGMAWCTRSDNLHLRRVNAELLRELHRTGEGIRADGCPRRRCVAPPRSVIPAACPRETVDGELRLPLSREFRRGPSVPPPCPSGPMRPHGRPVADGGMTPTAEEVAPAGCSMSATDGGVSCTLRLKAPADFGILTLRRPDRLVLRLRGTHDLSPELPGNAAVRRVRVGIQGNGDTHLVFDLKRPVRKVEVSRDAPNVLRVTLR